MLLVDIYGAGSAASSVNWATAPRVGSGRSTVVFDAPLRVCWHAYGVA